MTRQRVPGLGVGEPVDRLVTKRNWLPLFLQAFEVFLAERDAVLVSLACDPDIFEEVTKFIHVQGLRTVDQCLAGVGMEIDQHHVSAGNDTLRSHVKDIEYAFAGGITRPDRV